MKISRPSAFTTTPEELLARASDFSVEDSSPVETAIFVRELAKSLEGERLRAAGTSSVYKELNLTIGRLEAENRRLRAWKSLALAAIPVIALLLVALLLALVWGTHALH